MIPNFKNAAPFLGAAGIAFLSFERQILMLLVFIFLVFMDCFTRWTAISSSMLRCGGEDNPGLWEAVKAIPEARRQGLIKSAVMKKQGIEKIILYNLSVLTAAATDFLLQSSGNTPFLTSAVVSYLAVTESLSIVENLSDAGVGNLGALVNRLKGRI
jgi:formate-dependent nitrite reductase membrane component NrfD